jgi:hypothetical protein
VEQYPRLTQGPGFGPARIWENDALLTVLQASQGLMAPEIEAVSVQALPRSIVIHVCLRESSEAATEDLDDLVAETEALLAGVIEPMVDIDVSIHIGESGPRWPGYLHRRLYMIHPRVRALTLLLFVKRCRATRQREFACLLGDSCHGK